jgi:predicted MPP superfamily phosphohydrolase
VKTLVGVVGGVVLAAALALAFMYSVALRDPVVRQANVEMPDWPKGAAPIRMMLLTDMHVSGPDMPPSRLARIVDQVNRLHPDIVLLGGDFVSDKRSSTKSYAAAEAVAPLAALRAPLGTYGVLGNHDHWRGVPEVVAAMRRAGIHLLVNEAAAVGPLSLGGTDDAFTGNDRVRATVGAMRRLNGVRVLLSHSPDVVGTTPPDVSLILAGHTHCGQIRLPWIGALSYMSAYGAKYACGISRDGPKRVITSAGLGTSILPLRLGAVPDVWMVTLGPTGRPAR